jgi:hypothetical protein
VSAEVSQPHRLLVTISDKTNPRLVQTIPVVASASGYNGRFTPLASISSSSVQFRLQLASLAPDGSVLTSVTVQADQAILAPASFPSITPSKINLGVISRAKPVAVTLSVTGGTTAGCVGLGSLSLATQPHGITSVQVRSAQQGCVPIPAGSRRALHLMVLSRGAGSGRLNGTLIVALQDHSGAVAALHIPVSGQYILPINRARQLGLFATLVGLGILIPVLLMYVTARLGGRLGPISGLRFLSIPVIVTADGVTANPPLNPSLWVKNTKPVPDGAGNSRQITLPGGPTIRRRLSWNPFASPRAVAAGTGSDVVGSSGLVREHGATSFSGLIPTRIDAAWMFASDSRATEKAEPNLHGSLIILIAADGSSLNDPLGEAMASAARQLPTNAAPILAEIAAGRNKDDVDNPDAGHSDTEDSRYDPFAND